MTLLPIDKEFNAKHRSNADSPILVTLLDIVTEDNSLQGDKNTPMCNQQKVTDLPDKSQTSVFTNLKKKIKLYYSN